jgi:hypothetical protein
MVTDHEDTMMTTKHAERLLSRWGEGGRGGFLCLHKAYTYKFSPGQPCEGQQYFYICVKFTLRLARFKCFVLGLARFKCKTNT